MKIISNIAGVLAFLLLIISFPIKAGMGQEYSDIVRIIAFVLAAVYLIPRFFGKNK